MYAPETLPEKAIKDRDLKSYVEKARKVALKEEEQKEEKERKNSKKLNSENEENNKEYEEARKLAEKYY